MLRKPKYGELASRNNKAWYAIWRSRDDELQESEPCGWSDEKETEASGLEDDVDLIFARRKVVGILNSSHAITRRERLVLTLLYLREMTPEDVGRVIDVTGSRVKQIEEKALRRVKHEFSEVFKDLYSEYLERNKHKQPAMLNGKWLAETVAAGNVAEPKPLDDDDAADALAQSALAQSQIARAEMLRYYAAHGKWPLRLYKTSNRNIWVEYFIHGGQQMVNIHSPVDIERYANGDEDRRRVLSDARQWNQRNC